MSTVKILSSDGMTEIAEQQISETRNLFFESPTAPSLNSISTTPTNVFADDAADDAILWSDGAETPLTMSVSEASSHGTQTAALSLPENVISKKLAEVVDVNSVLEFNPGSYTITPESPSIGLRNTEGLDGKITALPFIKVGAMEVAINGTKLISGVNKDNKKITAANYADGSSFSINLGDNLPNSKLIDIVRAYYESRGAEVNIREGGGMAINPFANNVMIWSKYTSNNIAIIEIYPVTEIDGESYFFSFIDEDAYVPNNARFTFVKNDGTSIDYVRYFERVPLNATGSRRLCYARLAFPEAVHSYASLRVSLTVANSATASNIVVSNVMLSRSDILTPYTPDPAETEEQLAMLNSMDVAVSYPFATAIAGKPVFWKSWKLGSYNAPAKTVTAGYSSGMTDPVMSVTKNSVGGVDSSAINVGINGKATTGHYLDEKGAPLSGLFFSSRTDLQTSAGFLAKWLFAACARKLTVTQPRGGSFGEVMEEQSDNSTNYYMFAPPAQPLNGYTVNIPSVPTSRAIVTWREEIPDFSSVSSTLDITFERRDFLGFHAMVIHLKSVKPAVKIASYAAVSGKSWFTFPANSPFYQEPKLSSAYQILLKRYTFASGKFSAVVLGFTRTSYNFTNRHVTESGMMAETVTLRNDAPCRFVETWEVGPASVANQKEKYLDVEWNGQHVRHEAFNTKKNHVWVFIVTFEGGISAPTMRYYDALAVWSFPDNVTSIQIGYYSSTMKTFTPKLYYYQLNQN